MLQMKQILRTILREPYFHFMGMGLILYAIYSVYNPENSSNNKINITLTASKKEALTQMFQQHYKRKANPAELALLTEKYYREEVLLHQAVEQKLYEQDSHIRSRLLTKMEHILNASKQQKEPTQKELHQYYEEHISQYSRVEEISFAHVYFSDVHYEELEERIKDFNTYHVNAKDAVEFGDIFEKGNHFTLQNRSQISTVFGNYFSRQILKTGMSRWYGPIKSKEGFHAVFVTQKKILEAYSFDEIEAELYLDYLREEKEHRQKRAYKKLSTQYQFKNEY